MFRAVDLRACRGRRRRCGSVDGPHIGGVDAGVHTTHLRSHCAGRAASPCPSTISTLFCARRIHPRSLKSRSVASTDSGDTPANSEISSSVRSCLTRTTSPSRCPNRLLNNNNRLATRYGGSAKTRSARQLVITPARRANRRMICWTISGHSAIHARSCPRSISTAHISVIVVAVNSLVPQSNGGTSPKTSEAPHDVDHQFPAVGAAVGQLHLARSDQVHTTTGVALGKDSVSARESDCPHMLNQVRHDVRIHPAEDSGADQCRVRIPAQAKCRRRRRRQRVDSA